MPYFHPLAMLLRELRIYLRTQAVQTCQIIHPQPHAKTMLVCQLPRQPPAHADIAVVVDDVAEDVTQNRERDTVFGWHHNFSSWFAWFVDTRVGKVAEWQNSKHEPAG